MKIRIEKAGCAFEPELFKTAFGFKGNKLSGVWQTAVMLFDGNEIGIGLGVQSVLWSDSAVFARYGEDKSNELMFAVTEYAAGLTVGKEFSSPKEMIDLVFAPSYEYAQKITEMKVTETFVLNALVPLDMAMWQLSARLRGEDEFDFIYGGYERCEKLANIPLITYGTPIEEVKRMADEGVCVFKIKLGYDPDGDGDLSKMLEWDKKRALLIHNALKDVPTPYTESGRIVYYFDANGRYDTKDRLGDLVRFFEEQGIAQRCVLFEEPFAPDNKIFVGDIPICFAADESAHSLNDVKERIALGYKAITLKPIAKTLTVSREMADAAYAAGVQCFCADLTVNPLMVEWNKNFAARLRPLSGMKIGVVESNGAQNYVNWEKMKRYVNRKECESDATVYTLDGAFYNNAGGLFTIPEHYKELVLKRYPDFFG